MDAAYIPLKLVHMLAVAASGTLFFLRGLAINFFAAKWPMNAPVRYASYTIDTVLLAAAIALTIVIGQYPFVDSWLTVKVLLVIVYIGLGTFALKRGRTAGVRIVFWVAALAVFAFIASVAVTHSPWGWFARM